MSRFRLFATSLQVSLALMGAATAFLGGHPGPDIRANSDQCVVSCPAPYRLDVRPGRVIVEWGEGSPDPIPPDPTPPDPTPPGPDPTPIPPVSVLRASGWLYRQDLANSLRSLRAKVEARTIVQHNVVADTFDADRKAAARKIGDTQNQAVATFVDPRSGRIIDPTAYGKALGDLADGMSMGIVPVAKKGP